MQQSLPANKISSERKIPAKIADGMNLQKRVAPTAALTNNRFVGGTGTLGTIIKGLPEIQTTNPKNPAFDQELIANAVVNQKNIYDRPVAKQVVSPTEKFSTIPIAPKKPVLPYFKYKA